MTPISSTFADSCVLACLESVCVDNGLAFNQSDTIEKYDKEFPKWKEKKGAMEFNEIQKLLDLSQLPFAVETKNNPSEQDAINELNQENTGGILLGVRKVYNEIKELYPSSHCFRMDIEDSNFKLMEPATNAGENPFLNYTWQEIQPLQPELLILKRK